MAYKHWAVEVHTKGRATGPNTFASYVFVKEFSEEFTAQKCFDLTEAEGPIYEVRLWYKNKLSSAKGIA